MKDRAKIGLALGAGASRGFAHIGVLEVLTEAGMPIDMVSGSSMGSIIGGLYCAGMKISYAHKIAQQITRNQERRYFDVGLPGLGLFRGQRVEKLIRTLCGNKKIEDLKIPFVATAFCIEDARIVYIDRGDMTQAIRASISIPGVFEPVEIGGKTYVDAGVLDRVPTDALRQMGADYIVGVDVGYRGGENHKPESMMELLLMFFDAVEWEVNQKRNECANLMITVPTRIIDPTHFTRAAECIELGRKAALESLDQIRKDLAERGVPMG
jgi:NTE family protein